jgi:integral membrane protein (TIGR01906 family)
MSAVERGLSRGVGWVVTLLTPFVLIMASVRMLLSHTFLQLEYRAPGFPPDDYGFTLADRLHWGGLSVDYLLNKAGINFLADLHFDTGDPIYNARELSHMADVKTLVQTTLQLWVVALVVLVLLALLAVWRKWGREYLVGLSRGGWLTVGVIVLILAGVGISFDWLFTEFHHLFFTGDSWLFLYSDTLIRLFPIRFWQDGFILMGIFCLVCGLILGIVLRPGKIREQKSGVAHAE